MLHRSVGKKYYLEIIFTLPVLHYSTKMKIQRQLFRITPITCFVSILLVSVVHGQVTGKDRDFEIAVDGSIDLGIEFLFKELNTLHGWTPELKYKSGYIALQLYAFLKNDVSYLHPVIQNGLRELNSYPLEKVYSVSLAIMAYGAVFEQMDEDADSGSPLKFFKYDGHPPVTRSEILKKMRSALSWLLAVRIRNKGVWGYGAPSISRSEPEEVYYDHSNSQFAILALGIAEKMGLDVPTRVWDEIADHFTMAQASEGEVVKGRPVFHQPVADVSKTSKQPKKSKSKTIPFRESIVQARGWKYSIDKYGKETTFSMTSAGQSSILLALKSLPKSRLTLLRREEIERSIRDGYGWLTRYLEHPSGLRYDPYALYSLEKVGDIGGVEKFGNISWFERGADVLISRQDAHGGWGQTRSYQARYKTALALLFLGRATSLDSSGRKMIQITGGGSSKNKQGFSLRYYVFLPTLDVTVPVIRFFRMLRYRPTAKLLKLSEELLTSYDPNYSDEVVHFILTLKRSPSRQVKEHETKLLTKLTGLDSGRTKDYLDWASEWRDVVEIGQRQDTNRGKYLRGRLLQSLSIPLQLKIIWALQRTNERAAIEELLILMTSERPQLRDAAHDAVVFLSGKDFPFHPEASEKIRTRELSIWIEWWGKNSETNN